MELSQLAPIIPHNDKNIFVKDMEKYVEEVNEMYTFPMDISLQDGSKVQLIGAEPGFAGGEIMYIVNYVSALPKIEGNEAKVEEESRLLHKKMLETFKGFDEDIAHVVYKAFEELPFERKAYYSYGTVINIEEQK